MAIRKFEHLYWENFELNALKGKECLCANCERTKNVIGTPYSPCPLTAKLNKIREENNVDIMITRCGATDKITGTLLYVPREK